VLDPLTGLPGLGTAMAVPLLGASVSDTVPVPSWR
jgi:hypothetical protein